MTMLSCIGHVLLTKSSIPVTKGIIGIFKALNNYSYFETFFIHN